MDIRDTLKGEIKVLTFDQYRTIVDMQRGLTEAVTPFLKEKDWTGKPDSCVTWLRRTRFENSMIDALCDRGHTPYREIGQRAVAYVMDRCRIAYTQDEVRAFVAAIVTSSTRRTVVSSCSKGGSRSPGRVRPPAVKSCCSPAWPGAHD